MDGKSKTLVEHLAVKYRERSEQLKQPENLAGFLAFCRNYLSEVGMVDTQYRAGNIIVKLTDGHLVSVFTLREEAEPPMGQSSVGITHGR